MFRHMVPRSPSRPPRLAGFAALAVVLAAAGCGTLGARHAPPAARSPAVVHYEMEPMVIEAKTGKTGLEVESFDAEELFEQGGAALSQSRHDEAIALYDKLLTKFPGSPWARPALYNRGLAHRDKKDWPRAIDSFRELADRHKEHADAKDALFQLGACYAEQENWPTSGEVFARILERQDLNADDRIEAIARRGFAQFKLGDLDLAERTFRQALAFRQQIEQQERGLLVQVAFHLGLRQAQGHRPETLVGDLPEVVLGVGEVEIGR